MFADLNAGRSRTMKRHVRHTPYSEFIHPKRVSMQISENTVVSIHYTLTNNAGETIDSSIQRGEPLAYLHGAGNITAEKIAEERKLLSTFKYPSKMFGARS